MVREELEVASVSAERIALQNYSEEGSTRLGFDSPILLKTSLSSASFPGASRSLVVDGNILSLETHHQLWRLNLGNFASREQ